MKHTTLILISLLLSVAASTTLCSQSRIVAAPDAVELRKVWEQTGRHLRTDEYGTAMWGGIDISGDGIADFAVYQAKGEYPNTWHFYRGGESPDTSAFWHLDSMSRLSPLIGSFFGDERRSVVVLDSYREITDTIIWDFDRVRVFGIEEGPMLSELQFSVNFGSLDPPVQRYYNAVHLLDVNGDSIDDLLFSITSLRRADSATTLDDRGQIWIYLGGPDFQIDSPSVIVYDVVGDSGVPDSFLYSAALNDYDGDGRIDVKYSNSYAGFGPLVRFRWGDENSPQSWATRPVDRTINLNDASTGRQVQFVDRSYQLDAEAGRDFVSVVGNEDGTSSALIFLSSSGPVRSREFRREDADSVFVLPERFSYGGVSTSLNDTQHSVEMLPFAKPGQRIFLSGGSYGPDHDYEAFINEEREGWVLGDVTGDGWCDYGASYPDVGLLGARSGIAAIYAGGPYIPLDDTTLSVREEPVAGEAGGLFLWPNPVVDELHIAWRGDLKRMPARFEVYDVGGRLIASGDVEPGRGKALWMCDSVPSGVYILLVFDDTGQQLSTAEVIKL